MPSVETILKCFPFHSTWLFITFWTLHGLWINSYFFLFHGVYPKCVFILSAFHLKIRADDQCSKQKKNISILHLIGSRLNIIHFFYKRLKTKRKSKVIFCCCCWNSDNFPLTLIFRMSSFQIKFPNHSRPDL